MQATAPGTRGFVPFSYPLRESPFMCPVCNTGAGHLYIDEDTPEGACLSCKIDHEMFLEPEVYSDPFENANAGAIIEEMKPFAVWFDEQVDRLEKELDEQDEAAAEYWEIQLWAD